jgi:hypothetical protein
MTDEGNPRRHVDCAFGHSVLCETKERSFRADTHAMRNSLQIPSPLSQLLRYKKAVCAVASCAALIAVSVPSVATAGPAGPSSGISRPWRTVPQYQNCFRRYSVRVNATYFDETPEAVVPANTIHHIDPGLSDAEYRYFFTFTANGVPITVYTEDIWLRASGFDTTTTTLTDGTNPIGVQVSLPNHVGTFEVPRGRWAADYPTYTMADTRTSLSGEATQMGTWTHNGSQSGFSAWGSIGQPSILGASLSISHSDVVDYCKTTPRF